MLITLSYLFCRCTYSPFTDFGKKVPKKSIRDVGICKYNLKRGRNAEGRILFYEKVEDHVLFNEVQKRELDNFLLQSSNGFEDTICTSLYLVRYKSHIEL